MSITKIERKYIDAKDYVLDEIIYVAETINYRKRTQDSYDKQLHLFTHLCSIYANAFDESLSVAFDSDGFIEKITEKEKYMIRKFSAKKEDWLGGASNVSF